MVTLAGAMSTAELGISFAEMIRQDKVQIISCTGANLEEDIMNLVAHSHYKRVPNYRELSPQQEWELLENHYNRVTDTWNKVPGLGDIPILGAFFRSKNISKSNSELMVLCTVHRISPNTESPPGPKNPDTFINNDKFDGKKPSGK